jgi:dihydroneopterin aldolase
MNYKMYKNITIFATHGHAIQEKELGQKFVLEITLFGEDLSKVDAAVSEAEVERFIQDEAIDVHRDMIQAVSGHVADLILEASSDALKEVRIEVKKPSTPIRIGMPGGLVKYVSTTVSRRKDGYAPVYEHLEDYNFTKIRSARVFDKDVRIEADLTVAFDMGPSIENDDIAYSYSYTTVYDVAVDTIRANKGDKPYELAQKMIEKVYEDKPDAKMVQATVRNFLPENNLSVDYMEYMVVK